MDFAGPLLAAGLNLAQRLIVSWVEHGKSRVKLSEVDQSIAKEAQAEADRLRLRVDDLERATHRMLSELFHRTPQISYSRAGFPGSPSMDLQFNPRDPKSSKAMLADLKARVAELNGELVKWDSAPAVTAVPQIIFDADAPADTPSSTSLGAKRGLSGAMIEELRDRVRRAENPRS